MANQVPEKLINFRVYNEGRDLVGIADAELPALESMTETVSGAGIAGEVDSPTLGHFGSMSLSLTWRTITKDAAKLAQQRAHQLELRGSQQVYDAGAGIYRTVPVRVVAKATPKNLELGSLAVGAMTDTSSEFEVVYLKVVVDGEEIVEIDKYNFIARIAGTDYLASVRRDMGL